jgi:parvulin-like peptidyl-prolyl isomerase
MNRSTLPITFCLGLCLLVAAAGARAELPPDVLAKNRWMQLTRADYEAAIARVPKNLRYEFATSPRRIQEVLNNLLVTKTLAAQARAHGSGAEKTFGQRPSATDDSDRALANAELKRVEADANKSFDDGKAQFEAKALETYKLDPDAYRVPEELRLSDIAVLIKDRGDDAARQRAAEARAKIVAGSDFAAVAREYSDDPTNREKGGELPFMSAKRMAPDYAKVVFALKQAGDISPVIKAPAAYHVVRLNERRPSRLRPFEEVQASIMQSLRKRYVDEQRDLRIQAIHRDPSTEANQAAIDALVNRVDPELFRTKPDGARVAPPVK